MEDGLKYARKWKTTSYIFVNGRHLTYFYKQMKASNFFVNGRHPQIIVGMGGGQKIFLKKEDDVKYFFK